MSGYKGLEFLYPRYTEMVDAHKKGVITDEQYRRMYKDLLGKRWVEVEKWLNGLKVDEDITLICFCPEGKFCHRRQIASLIKVYRPDLAHLVITH